MKTFNTKWLDKNGMVMPQPSEKPADNGVLFTSVAVLLGYDFPNYIALVRACFLKPGLLARWSGNNFDQSTWDDYLAIATTCIYLREKKIPREILTYGVTHFFVFNTDGKLKGEDFLLRNFPIWSLMVCAAFPFTRYFMLPLLWLTQLFFKKPDLSDTSAIQLQWIYYMGCAYLGFNFKKLDAHASIIKKAFAIYYHKEHPFNND